MAKHELFKTSSAAPSEKNEFEIVPNTRLRHVNIFIHTITHRNFHFHNEIEIFSVLSGNAVIRRNSDLFLLSPGSIVLLNPNEVHDISSSGGVTCLVFQLSNSFADTYYPQLRSTMFTCAELRSAVSADVLRDVWLRLLSCSLLFFKAEELFELRCVAGICELLALLLQNIPNHAVNDVDNDSRKRISQRIERLSTYINSNYQYPIRLSEVAEEEGVSPTHLSHFFTDNFGVSFQQYINNIRFEHAVRLMYNSSMSVPDIAAASGFSDQKYMSRMFVEHFNCKPKDFRAKYSDGGITSLAEHKVPEQQYNDAESVRLLEEFSASLDTIL